MPACFISISLSPFLYLYTITLREAAPPTPSTSTVADKPLRTEQQRPCSLFSLRSTTPSAGQIYTQTLNTSSQQRRVCDVYIKRKRKKCKQFIYCLRCLHIISRRIYKKQLSNCCLCKNHSSQFYFLSFVGIYFKYKHF